MRFEHDNTAVSPSHRILAILEVLAREARPMTATEINETLGLPKPTIHRLVANLEENGYLTRQLDGRSFLPGFRLRLMMLGVMQANQHDMARHGILVRLYQAVGETCSISIPDGDSLIYVDRVETHWPLRLVIDPGSRVPLHATAAGKVCLAYMNAAVLDHYLANADLPAHTDLTVTSPSALREDLAVIRKQGYAIDKGEFIPGMVGASVPAIDSRGKVIAALTFHAPAQRMSYQQMVQNLAPLRLAAEELSQMV